MDLQKLQFPIGQCVYQEEYSREELNQMILDIETFPARLEAVVQHYSITQLETCYRPRGWTVNQVIHHCADSHINALVRIKLALTTENPTINPYPEDKWALMPDYQLPFNNSITLLFAVHRKLVLILKSLTEDEMNKTYWHPQYEKQFRIKDVICLYAWHGNHHLAHVKLVQSN